ncbi:IPTL-CTERM sorting domain-containing protein [Brevundimonas staleyi]|uniref:IPTL-CTERM sorting domain-containing protein n=1 Tax=Brevundimonas staleyi TaxID=74326 RepID=A0ABW0FU79_9CAUL
MKIITSAVALDFRALIKGAVLAGALLLTPAVASAQTTTDYTAGTVTAGYYLMAGSDAGQSFTVPAGVQSIQSVSIGVSQGGGGPRTVSMRLRTFTGGAIGATDIASRTETVAANYPATPQIVLTVPGGRAVTANEQYIILVEDTAVGLGATIATQANVYPGGAFYVSTGVPTSEDAFFKVTYQNTIVAAPVPTMTEWAMILLGLMLAGGAALVIQRRQGFGQV